MCAHTRPVLEVEHAPALHVVDYLDVWTLVPVIVLEMVPDVSISTVRGFEFVVAMRTLERLGSVLAGILGVLGHLWLCRENWNGWGMEAKQDDAWSKEER